MRSGFKMKQSPAKRGDIQGTSGHANALKASPARIGGLLKLGSLASKARNYFKGAKKVKDVVKTTTTNYPHKLTNLNQLNKSTKAYKEMVAKQADEVKKATELGKSQASKTKWYNKALIGVGAGTAVVQGYKAYNWMMGVGSTDAKANNTDTPKTETKTPSINDKNFKKYKRKE